LLLVQVKQEMDAHIFPAANRIAELTDAMRAAVRLPNAEKILK
jgi:hypothetical protein